MTWIQTFTGRKFYPLEPRAEDVCIEDIAHALSNVCRFAGHCSEFYSVAQHCVYASERVADRRYRMEALLHDAAEAYIGDIPRTIKCELRIPVLECRILRAIGSRFNVRLSPKPSSVCAIDNALLATEARDLMFVHAESPSWEEFALPDPLDIKITPLTPRLAESAFLHRFKELGGVIA